MKKISPNLYRLDDDEGPPSMLITTFCWRRMRRGLMVLRMGSMMETYIIPSLIGEARCLCCGGEHLLTSGPLRDTRLFRITMHEDGWVREPKEDQ